MTMRVFIAGLAIAAALTPTLASAQQDEAIQGDSQKVVIDTNRVDSPSATANAHCLRWRARAVFLGARDNWVTYKCVPIDR